MLESIGTFFGALRQASPVFFLGVAIASGTILFASDNLLSTLGLAGFRASNRAYLGGAFVLSLALVVAHALWSGGKGVGILISQFFKRRKSRRSNRSGSPFTT